MRCRPALVCCVFIAQLGFAGFAPADDWPQWQGLNRDALTNETGLLKTWPYGGPPRVWLYRDCGKGYAGPAIVGDRLYILGSRNGIAYLLCLDVTSGTEIWHTKIGPEVKNRWGDGPRATPTVDGELTYVLGGQGSLVCVRTADGSEVWRKTMRELGGSIPSWGFCESVLVDGDWVVCTPGGEAGAVAALNKQTGDLVWQSADVPDNAHYSSIIRVAPHGRPQYVQLLEKRLIGLAVADGRLLWQLGWPGATAVVPTPIFHNNAVYVTSGYGAGSMLAAFETDGTATDVYRNKVMKNHHGGAIRLGDYIYGYSDGVGWVCQDFYTGERVWRERSALGKGAIGYADGRFYCLDEESGVVVLIEASPDGWNEQGRFTLQPQTQIRSNAGGIWVHPVIAGGKLYLRDQDLLYCYDVRE